MCLITTWFLLHRIQIFYPVRFLGKQFFPLKAALHQLFVIPMSLGIPCPHMVRFLNCFLLFFNFLVEFFEPASPEIRQLRIFLPFIVTGVKLVQFTLQFRLLADKFTQ